MKRRAFRTLFGAIAATLAIGSLAIPATASSDAMLATGTVHDNPATFTVIEQRTADGNTIQSAVVDGVIDGTFVGTYVERARAVFHPTGEGNIEGTATCSCRVGSLSGTIVFGFNAKAEANGSLTVHFAIVSADGGLRGLHGVGTITSPDGLTGSYSAEIHF